MPYADRSRSHRYDHLALFHASSSLTSSLILPIDSAYRGKSRCLPTTRSSSLEEGIRDMLTSPSRTSTSQPPFTEPSQTAKSRKRPLDDAESHVGTAGASHLQASRNFLILARSLSPKEGGTSQETTGCYGCTQLRALYVYDSCYHSRRLPERSRVLTQRLCLARHQSPSPPSRPRANANLHPTPQSRHSSPSRPTPATNTLRHRRKNGQFTRRCRSAPFSLFPETHARSTTFSTLACTAEATLLRPSSEQSPLRFSAQANL